MPSIIIGKPYINTLVEQIAHMDFFNEEEIRLGLSADNLTEGQLEDILKILRTLHRFNKEDCQLT